MKCNFVRFKTKNIQNSSLVPFQKKNSGSLGAVLPLYGLVVFPSALLLLHLMLG